MNARMDTIKRLAESDPYWRGYLDGMTAAHHDNSAAHEYARLSQARIDRNTDTTDYDAEWTRTPTSADCLREYEATTAGRLEHIQKRINALLDSPEVRGAIQQCAGADADWEDYYRQMQARFER